MKSVAIVQARMGASRLPGKVLADLCGQPMLQRLLDRVRAADGIDEIVVATTTQPPDDELVAWLRARGIAYFRGSEQDVLDRFYQCARQHAADVIVRVTADDPLKDPGLIAAAIRACTSSESIDYCSNSLVASYPEGLDIEVVRSRALERAHREATKLSDREHVTPYIWRHPQLFRLHSLQYERNLADWRWTVDKPADLEFMRAVFGHFADPLVPFTQVIAWLERNPAVRAINAGTQRNEGYLKSLEGE